MKIRLLWPVAAAPLIAAVTLKGATSKLVIQGEALAGYVEIVDAPTLALSNVFTGNYFDSTRTVPAPAGQPVYDVSFYLPAAPGLLDRLRSVHRLTRAYVVELAVDTATHTAAVYLPGANDTWSGWNHATIIRETQEGRWHPAAPAWSARLVSLLMRAPPRRLPSCPAAPALLQAGDTLYRDVQEITPLLEARGLHVRCAYQSTFSGVLGQSAIGVLTDAGPFGLVVFPTAAAAQAVTVTSTVRDGQLMTVLHGPDQRRRVDSMAGADHTDFLFHGRWMIDTWGQPSLRSRIETALTTQR